MNDPYLTLPLTGLRLIEASAGTGKTFTLATLFTRLVVEQHLRMGQILAVTFTEAATQELRARIRDRLELAARLLDLDASLDEDQQTVLTRAILERALHAQSKPQLQARLRLAAEETDLAAIFTIHGFCTRMLREYALESGQSLDALEIVPQPGDLYAEVAADVWRHYAEHAESAQILGELWNSPDELAADLPALTGDLPLYPAAPEQLPEDPRPQLEMAGTALKQAIDQYWDSARDSIEAAFDNKTFNGRKARRESFKGAFVDLKFWPHGDNTHVEKLAARRLISFCNEGKAPPQSPLFDAIQHWYDLDARRRQWLAQRKSALVQQLRLDLRQRLAGLKQQRRIQTYDDLIQRLAAALQGPNGERLAARIRAQYQFALVDEFQDTDARQWEIFQRVFAAPGEPAALFLIGDPKQAIYGFRGGDVHTYLHAKAQAKPAPPLTRNFRSRPALLRTIQSLYDRAGEAAFAGADIHFEPVEPGGRRSDADYLRDGLPAPALTVCLLDSEDAKPLPAETARERVTRACVADIHRVLTQAREQRALLDGRPVHPGEIAVLVRTHSEATRIQRALSSLGIAAVAAGRRSLYATDEAREVHQLLLSLLHPSDDARLRAALSSVLLGQDADTLATLDRDGDLLREWQQRAFAWRERWERAGVFALIAGICADGAQRLLTLIDGERRLTNTLQLAEILQEASARAIGTHGLVDWLATRMARADDRDETQQLRLESDARCVQILTLHKSKGLEYPLVYLPFIGIDTRSRGTARYREGYQHGQRVLYWNTAADSEDWKAACRDAEDAERAEAARLLYVGLTRARHALWLAGGALPGLDTSPLGPMLKDAQALPGPEIWIVRDTPSATPSLPRLPPEREQPLPPPRSARRRIGADWWVHSFTQLARQEESMLAMAGVGERAAEDEALQIWEEQSLSPKENGWLQASTLPPFPVYGRGREKGRGEGLFSIFASDSPAHPLPQTGEESHFSGPRFGNALHAALEATAFAAWTYWQPGDPAPATQTGVLHEALNREGYCGDQHPDGLAILTALLGHTLTTPLPEGGALCQHPEHQRRAEMEFHFDLKPVAIPDLLRLLHAHDVAMTRSGFGPRRRLHGLMTGKIDLTYLGQDGLWYVLDYKSNQLPGYGPAALKDAMSHSQYDLQALIYTLALHRWLRFRLGGEYDYARDFGGIRYLFCRGLVNPGEGIYAHRFAPELVHALDALLSGKDLDMRA